MLMQYITQAAKPPRSLYVQPYLKSKCWWWWKITGWASNPKCCHECLSVSTAWKRAATAAMVAPDLALRSLNILWRRTAKTLQLKVYIWRVPNSVFSSKKQSEQGENLSKTFLIYPALYFFCQNPIVLYL